MIKEISRQRKEDRETEFFVHPQKFVLWLFIVASVMLFAAFTSAYIVRRGEGNWLIFDLPQLFKYNTFILVLSSVSIHWAYFSAKQDNVFRVKLGLIITLMLGATFGIAQWFAYKELVGEKIFLTGNPAESFIYVITFVHLIHIVAGMLLVSLVAWKAWRYEVHKKNLLSINICVTYWHFLGALWIYLYFFFLLNR